MRWPVSIGVHGAGAELRALAQRVQHPLGPRQQRPRVAPLGGDVHLVGGVRLVGDDRPDELLDARRREPGVGPGVPLHRRADGVAFGKAEVLAHADLVAVAEHRRARQRGLERVGHLQPPPVAVEHGRQAAADAAVVELHLGLGPEGVEHLLALAVAEPAEVDLVVVAQERRPLARRRDGRRRFQGSDDRRGVLTGEGEERALVEQEVEHHVQPVAVAEVLEQLLAFDVGLGEEDGVAPPPRQVLAEVVEVGEVQRRLRGRRAGSAR